MARPKKVGLDYFPLDCQMDDDVDLIVAEHGSKGFHILIKLYQRIYGNKGYFIEWNKRNQLLLSKKVSVDKNLVVSVVDDCIEWGIFNKEMYDKYNILTSPRIQKQYLDITYKRTEVEIITDYLLIERRERENITYKSVSDNENQEVTKDSDDINSQSKVKKSKVKKSKEKKESNVCPVNNNRQNKSNESDQIRQLQSSHSPPYMKIKKKFGQITDKKVILTDIADKQKDHINQFWPKVRKIAKQDPDYPDAPWGVIQILFQNSSKCFSNGGLSFTAAVNPDNTEEILLGEWIDEEEKNTGFGEPNKNSEYHKNEKVIET